MVRPLSEADYATIERLVDWSMGDRDVQALSELDDRQTYIALLATHPPVDRFTRFTARPFWHIISRDYDILRGIARLLDHEAARRVPHNLLGLLARQERSRNVAISTMRCGKIGSWFTQKDIFTQAVTVGFGGWERPHKTVYRLPFVFQDHPFEVRVTLKAASRPRRIARTTVQMRPCLQPQGMFRRVPRDIEIRRNGEMLPLEREVGNIRDESARVFRGEVFSTSWGMTPGRSDMISIRVQDTALVTSALFVHPVGLGS